MAYLSWDHVIVLILNLSFSAIVSSRLLSIVGILNFMMWAKLEQNINDISSPCPFEGDRRPA